MNQHEIRAIGLMSGTSLDGLDLAHVVFRYDGQKWNFTLYDTLTHPYNAYWETQLAQAQNLSPKERNALSSAYSAWLGEVVNQFREDYHISQVDLIASHGHTVFHQPNNRITEQIGNNEALCTITKLPLVCDFRLQDVLLGGQGAPLVPIGDALLFSEYDACLNLGGFANISFEQGEKRIAFDICPVNIVLNHLSQELGHAYDANGNFARQGIIDHDLLNQLNKLSYYSMQPPKSLGREWVEAQIFPNLKNTPVHDSLRTFTEHIAQQIAAATAHLPHQKLLITGGGAFNGFLLERISATSSMQITLPEKAVITHKEALIFAFLGTLRWLNKTNCLSSVTGALRNHSSGRVFMPKSQI